MSEVDKGQKVKGHDQSAFGKWHHKNKSKFGNVKAFTEIEDHHRKGHEADERLSNYCTSENVKLLMQAYFGILKGFIELYENYKKIEWVDSLKFFFTLRNF